MFVLDLWLFDSWFGFLVVWLCWVRWGLVEMVWVWMFYDCATCCGLFVVCMIAFVLVGLFVVFVAVVWLTCGGFLLAVFSCLWCVGYALC